MDTGGNTDTTSKAVGLITLLIGLMLIANPIVGFSRILPKGAFHLISGLLLAGSGIYWYRQM